MNLAYAHQQKNGWNPENLHFAEGSGDSKWLTCDCRGPWKVQAFVESTQTRLCQDRHTQQNAGITASPKEFKE